MSDSRSISESNIKSIINSTIRESDNLQLISDNNTVSNTRTNDLSSFAYLEICDNSISFIDEFYNKLPESIQRVIQTTPYEDGQILISYKKVQVKDDVTHFNIELDQEAKDHLLNAVEYLQWLYTETSLPQENLFKNNDKIKQVETNKLYVHSDLLPVADVDPTNNKNSVIRFLRNNRLTIKCLDTFPETHTYDYALTVNQVYPHNVNNLSSFRINRYITDIYESNVFDCENCGSKTVVHSVIQSDTFYCTNCKTEYNVESFPSIDTINSCTIEELYEVLNTKLSPSKPPANMRQIFDTIEAIGLKYNNPTNKTITVTDDSVPPNRTIVFEFDENSIIAHIITGMIYFKVRVSETVVLQNRSKNIHPCILCSSETTYTQYEFTGSVWTLSRSSNELSRSILAPNYLCHNCINTIFDRLLPVLKTNSSTEEIFSEMI